MNIRQRSAVYIKVANYKTRRKKEEKKESNLKNEKMKKL